MLIAPVSVAVDPAAFDAVTERLEPVDYIVGFYALPRGLAPGDDYNGGTVVTVNGALHFAVVRVSVPATFELRTSLDDNVRYLEEDEVHQWIMFTPNDPSFNSQYGPQQIRAPEAWDTTLGSTARAVCIVDTGVRYTHQDLTGSRWLGGYDYVNNDADPNDDNGHGTHVAGTAAAGLNNGLNIAGVANVGVYGVKVLNSAGSGSFSAIANGINWCADNGGDVISLSLGGSSGTSALADAVSYAWGQGALLVAAAGNSGPCSNCVSYPAKYADVMAVTCTTSSKSQCSFSSDGPESEITAPGNSVLSLWHTSNTATNTISGTSMSTPHVSGAAALVWSHATSLTNSELRTLLRDNAEDLGSPGFDQQFGYGLVDAKATLDAAGGGGDPPPPPPPEDTELFEDFDDGTANGFTLGGEWRVASNCASAASSPNYLGYHRSAACDYNTGAATSGSASFTVDLSAASSATLTFDHRWETESYASGAYDIMRVQVSTNGGASWTTLDQWDSRDSNQLSWGAYSRDVSAYTGGSTQFRFFFDSVDGVSNAFDGWFVDNVELTSDAGGGNPPPNNAPTANAGADQTKADDDGGGSESFTLNGSGSSDSDGSITSYVWTEGGSQIATGVTPTVSFATGSHTVTLTVTDDDGATDTDTVVITVNANQAPTASFTSSCTDLTCSFNGAGSSDPDGSISSYSWNFGDGSSGSGSAPSHTYGSAGTYTVTLTVTDNGGATDGSSSQVTATDPPTGPTTVYDEDFDTGSAAGWHKSGGANDLWRVASDCVTPASGSYMLAFSRAAANCDYDVGTASGWARSPTMDTTGSGATTLSFSHWWQTESYSGGAYDIMRAQVSTNAGSTWTTVKQWDSRDANPSGWQSFSTDVSAYDSSSFRLRFEFDTVDGTANDYDGWYVDNVLVTKG